MPHPNQEMTMDTRSKSYELIVGRDTGRETGLHRPVRRFSSLHEAQQAMKALPDIDRKYAWIAHPETCKCANCWNT